MFIIRHRKIFYTLSGILIAASIGALLVWGLNLGIDFKGGSLLGVSYTDARPEKTAIENALAPLGISASVRPAGETGYIIRARELSDAEHRVALGALSFGGKNSVEEVRFTGVGPLLGKEAMGKSLIALALVLLLIVLFITFSFRKVSAPISSWKYGLLVIVGLVHDIIIPVGLFAFLGFWRGVEVDTLFVTALLVILGYSVHDKIVVFDRVRENLRLAHAVRDKETFGVLVGRSISQTLVRSLNTSLTTLIALIFLWVLGPASTAYFSFALIVGIITGTYSSLCLSAPLLVTVEKLQKGA